MEEEKLESYKQKIDEEVTQEIQKRLSEMEEQLVDLSAFSSWDEMRALGSEMLKNHLMCRGLKAGGNLEMRAKRLFSARFETAAKSLDPKIEKLIRLEQAFLFYVDLLNSKIYKTIDNVQRKQAGAYDDSDSELEESEEDDENDQIIPYNPKNLPLQADGMPIPYWLYKLQGLKFTFACEICGNHVYRGPKSFQKHFSESRHAHGMKCLGIPNTSHFFFVTSIEEVLDLHQKIKDDRKKLQWDGTDEEMEDTFGNTMKRKVWLDLKRQGCI
jgi:splicing factor 3A subunit 3